MPVTPRPGPGRPRTYCDNPKHNAVARHRYVQRLAKARAAAEQPAPVAERVSALVDAVQRIERLKGQLVAEIADAEQLAADLADVDVLAVELESVQALAVARVRQAEADRDAALVLRDLARQDSARVRHEAADTVTRMREDCDRQIAAVAAVADAEIERAITAHTLGAERPRCRIAAG
ncbi:hypothetical protein [Nocardia sp. IFM 10818]